MTAFEIPSWMRLRCRACRACRACAVGADWFRITGTLASENIGLVETPVTRAYDIENFIDFEAVELMFFEK